MSSRQGTRTKLSSRFIAYFTITYLVMIGLMGFIVDRTVQNTLIDDVDTTLATEGRLASLSIPDDPAAYQVWAESVYDAAGFRVTLIDTDGVVLADSHTDPVVMENHLSRPEVQTALSGQVGEDQRTSGSTGAEQRYVALPPEDGLIVRTSLPTRVIDEHVDTVRRSILITAALLGLLGMGLMAYLARRLAQPITELTDQARAVADGDADITPRRSAVEELDELGLALSTMATRLGSRLADAEQATRTLGVVLEALPQGTILIDAQDTVLYANPAARTMIGTIPETLSALSPFQFQNAVREARETAETRTQEVDHGSPTRRLRALATPFTDDERVLLLVVDITERERVDSIRRDFVANASHELKTPVATIIASSEAMRIALERDDDSAANFAARVEDSARQLDRLVTDLLDLSRVEREQPALTLARLDHLVRDEVERIRDVAIARHIEIEVDVVETFAALNPHDMAIAVRNILDNAVRYTPSGGSMSVRVGSEGNGAVVEVSDTGEGIPTRDIDRVFERFYRVDAARSRATGGTGLGLSIVRHVVEGHGGTVSVESELGVGSTFTIRLPTGTQGEETTSH